jgi:DNA-directed RNA polymerase II subunit RPB1
MALYKLNNELEDNNFSKIDKLQLSLLNPDFIKKGAVCEIFNSETYEGGEPKINGLFDPRMGTTDKNGICVTCECFSDICPGHFGKIELAMPFFNINTIDIVKKLLKCVCIRCSNVLVDKNNPNLLLKLKNKKDNERFGIIYTESTKIKKCQNNSACFKLQPNKYEKLLADKIISNDIPLAIFADISSEAIKTDDPIQNNKIKIRPLDCYNIFRRITDADCEFFGFDHKLCRPEWLLLSVLPVPPPCVRPAAIHDNDLRAEDDLTHLLNNIVKTNNKLKDKIKENADKKTIDTHFGLLQLHLISYINNEVAGIPPQAQRSSRTLKGLVQRLKQKEGRVRSNLMGKRVDYSGRTVISVDPNIDIDEYGVPFKVAMNVTFPEKVTKYNIAKMNILLENGPNKYPGVKRIKKKEILDNGDVTYSEYSLNIRSANTIKLDIGDTVFRHLIDGDIVLFNRQPTLHRMGMMGHRIKVLPYSTFRLNVTTTTPYNADFDGDEMNAHFPQSYASVMELKHIALVPNQIITPGKSKPIMGIIQDTLVGSYCLTKFDIKLNKLQVMNLFSYDEKMILPEATGVENGVEYWSGKDVYSIIIPDISLNMLNNSEEHIFIDNGVLKKGSLDGKIIGASAGGLGHLIYNSYNPQVCKRFLDDNQKIITRWFEDFSLSFSMGDILPKREVINEMNNFKTEGLIEVEKILYKMNNGIFNPDLEPKYLRMKMEVEIHQTLEDIASKCTKILKTNLTDMNNLNRAITSGSKGKKLNMRQISGTVGYTDIWGERVGFKFTDRTLPHFSKHNYGAEARGFIKNSFINGMEPYETFFHAMGGRIGVIDTAVKTAGVGYVSRRLVKSLEDIKVQYDFTVRNSKNSIIQFAYGDDNMDPVNIERQRLEFIEYDNAKMLEEFYYDITDINNDVFLSMDDSTKTEFLKIKQPDIIQNEHDYLLKNRDILRIKYFKTMGDLDVIFYSPINLFRLINNIKYKFKITNLQLSDLTPTYIIEKTSELIDSFMFYIQEKESMLLLKLLIKSLLSTKNCIYKYRFTKSIFNHVIELIKDKIFKSFVQPGESVGIIVEQSYYEELQQATLNTFHTAGTGSAVSQGVERFSEIINVSKNLKTPEMFIYLKNEYNSNLEMAEFARSQIEYTKLEDIIVKSTISYNSNNLNIINDEKYEYIKIFHEFNDIVKTDICDEDNLSKWMLNFEFDKDKLISKNLTLIDINNIIINSFHSRSQISCIINDDNAATLNMVIRIRDNMDNTSYIHFLKELENKLLSITLHGIKGIEYSTIQKIKVLNYNPDGSYDVKEEHMLSCIGSNLNDILNHPMVDKYRTITNEIHEILQLLGIEAAREYLVREFNRILEEKIIYRHHALLADMMTFSGTLMQIARYGINKSSEYSPFAKASFEEVVDVLIKGSTFGEADDMNGVSSNIMVGQHCKIGTNFFDTLLDEDAFVENVVEYNMKSVEKIDEDELEKEIDDLYAEVDEITDADFETNIRVESTVKISKKAIPEIKPNISGKRTTKLKIK